MAATIKHLVVLMLENRSFDHMLGFMQSANYPIDGLDGSQLNRDSTGEPVKVNADAGYSGDLPHDPSHDFEDVMEQMYGTQTPAAGQLPTMSGFVQNYERFTGDRVGAHTIMNCFTPGALPVLATLASSYAICDHWFSSVPGPSCPTGSTLMPELREGGSTFHLISSAGSTLFTNRLTFISPRLPCDPLCPLWLKPLTSSPATGSRGPRRNT